MGDREKKRESDGNNMKEREREGRLQYYCLNSVFVGRIKAIYKKTTVTKLKQNENDVVIKVSMFYRYTGQQYLLQFLIACFLHSIIDLLTHTKENQQPNKPI